MGQAADVAPRQAEIQDVVVIGAGLIGLAVARELHGRNLRVLVLEKGAAGRGASWAGAGMLSARQTDVNSPLRPLALASAAAYPEFARRLEAEVGRAVDYCAIGTLAIGHGVADEGASAHGAEHAPECQPLRGDELRAAEPALAPRIEAACLIADHCVDNRRLVAALADAVRLRGIPLIEHCPVRAVAAMPDGTLIIRAAGPSFRARHVVYAAGAWCGTLAPGLRAVRPRKGQMLSLAAPVGLLRHVIVAPGVYLVPRSDGQILVGASVEDVGFDDGVDDAVIARMRATAVALIPALATAPVVEAWAGFRPGTPDDLPILGAIEPAAVAEPAPRASAESGRCESPGAGERNAFGAAPMPAPTASLVAAPPSGCWVAAGHFRDGILLTPITAQVIADLIVGAPMALDLTAFSAARLHP